MRKENTPVIVSSGRTNRKDFRIPIENLDFSEYLDNPVALSEHITGISVGRFEEIKAIGNKVQATPHWSSTPYGQQLKQQYMEGSLNAVSISGQCKLNYEKTIAEHFIVMEISWVTVPADPGAVAPFENGEKKLNFDIDTAQEQVYTPIQLSNKIDLSDYQYMKLSMDIDVEVEDKNIIDKALVMLKNITVKKENTSFIEIKEEDLSEIVLKTEKMVEEKNDEIKENDSNKIILKIETMSEEKEDEVKEDEIHKKQEVYESEEEKTETEEDLNEKKECMSENEELEEELSEEEKKIALEEFKKNKMAKKNDKQEDLKDLNVIHPKLEMEDKKVLSTKEWKERVASKIKPTNKTLSASHLEPIKLTHNKTMKHMGEDIKNININVKNNMNIDSFIKEEGEAGLQRLMDEGNETAMINLFDSIKKSKNRNAKVFFEKLNICINLEGKEDYNGSQKLSPEVFLNNREAFNQKLSYTGNVELNASNDFVENPSLDVISFANFAFLKTFAQNEIFKRMPMLPVNFVSNGVGVVVANVLFDPEVTTVLAGTDTTNPYVDVDVNQYVDTANSLNIYSHSSNSTLFKDFNMNTVNYDKMGYQWANVMKSVNERWANQDLYSIGNAINLAKIANPNLVTLFDSLTGNAVSTVGLWNLLRGVNTGNKKGITRLDITRILGYLSSQNINAKNYTPIIAMDAWMKTTFEQDPQITTILTKDVISGKEGQVSKILGCEIDDRSYYGRYDTSTGLIVSPTASSTSTMIQYGLVITPEYNIRGLSEYNVLAIRNPRTFGTEMSVQVKSGATVAFKDDAKGNSLILPIQ